MKSSKKVGMKRKDWAQVAERLCAANDILEYIHQNIHIPLSFKEELRKAQNRLETVEDIAFEESLSKKEHKEVFGK
jgi:lysyl-tRNA synthetase class I